MGPGEKAKKIPMLVIPVNIITAMSKYVLINLNAVSQFLCNQTAATSLPISRTLPIIIMASCEPWET